MTRKALHFLYLAAAAAVALPAPTEYTMEMLTQDLRDARLVARVHVLRLDTVVLVDPFGDAIGQFEMATLGVDSCFKGGLARGDTMVMAQRNIHMVGWYEPDYRQGEHSFMCFTDGWGDGVHAFAMTRAKFDISASDSVEPPPVGLGFSGEFANYLSPATFTRLLRQTVREQEFLHVAPLLPYTGTEIGFRTTIDLSGGAVLESVTLTHSSSTNRVDMELVYTPCTGICPLVYMVRDTTVSLASLPPGDYTAYRTKVNSLLDAIPVPDDTVQFTVYGTTSVLPQARAAVSPARAASHAAPVVVDLRGRTVPDRARVAPAAGLQVVGGSASALRPAIRMAARPREPR